MKSMSLQHRWYRFELGLITKFFGYKHDAMPKVSLLPMRLLLQSLEKYYEQEVNLAQNENLTMRTIASDITKATLLLERLVKHCKKNIVDEKDRHSIKIESVVTYIFFTDEAGNVLNISNYVTRIKDAMSYLMDFFEEHHGKQGTDAYANCVMIHMHLVYMHEFIGDLAHVFLNKPIK